MKNLLVFSFLLFCAANLFSQEKQDSIQTPIYNNNYYNLQEKLSEMEFYFELNSFEHILKYDGNRETIWLWTLQSLRYHDRSSPSASIPSHLTLPLYRQYLEGSKFDPIKIVLGIAQTGAVGFFAYKSIKKYGLFK